MSLVTVDRDDLLEVLRKVPPWVAMGVPGAGDWSPESLAAQDRLYLTVFPNPHPYEYDPRRDPWSVCKCRRDQDDPIHAGAGGDRCRLGT